MPVLMDFKCDACGRSTKYTPTTEHPEANPTGWRMRQFKKGSAYLCDWCNNPGNFHGGVSPRLREMLKARGLEIGDDE